jgi:hypothetical protein
MTGTLPVRRCQSHQVRRVVVQTLSMRRRSRLYYSIDTSPARRRTRMKRDLGQELDQNLTLLQDHSSSSSFRRTSSAEDVTAELAVFVLLVCCNLEVRTSLRSCAAMAGNAALSMR